MCIYDRESRSLKLSSSTIRERTNKIFESDLHDCSLASSSSVSWLIYLFVERAPRIIDFDANSVRPIVVFI
jgi:hypothetical protein